MNIGIINHFQQGKKNNKRREEGRKDGRKEGGKATVILREFS